MKFLKNIALSLFIAAFSAGISSVAFAGPAEAVDVVTEKISVASKAIDSGASSEDIIVLIREAARSVKQIPQGDNVDVKRQRANGQLKKARLAVKDGNLDVAQQHLAKATKGFSDLKGLF